jgi:hypothetical protein
MPMPGTLAAVFNRQAFLSRCIWHGGWKPPPLFCGYTFSQNAPPPGFPRKSKSSFQPTGSNPAASQTIESRIA